MPVKVAINGFGTIGKRVADAVRQQDDMEIVGVVKRRPTFEATDAMREGYPFYAASKENIPDLENAGIKVEGVLTDLLEMADIVIDCTPKKADYKTLYEKHNVKAIWQGGEKHALTGLSFNAMANYEEAIGKQFARVVSCNTTGLCRTLYPINEKIGIENVEAVMIRRAADPWDTKTGPINAIEPEVKVPSHHGPDVKTVMKGLKIQTMAVKVPTTLMHLHTVVVTLKKEVSSQEVLDIWAATPRVLFFSTANGIKSTAQVMEWAKDTGRKRGDLFEIAVWKDGVHAVNDRDENVKDFGRMLYYSQAIHQESDVIPENIDCIRAMCELETDKLKSIKKTDDAMGMLKV
ncbi:MAG: type II glyceraldehyde-3-phosphate dehydrogenase [Candidatus Thermoplasmatota archaeon]|nr:type II glyceraldehyde-3-phosphate dehydrogenase [Candidatus Thermoplasmatota archaeon]